MLTLATEPTSNEKKPEYVPSALFGFTDVDKEKDTVYKMTDAVNKTGRFLADQAQQYRLTESNGSAKAWTAVNVGDITKFFTGVRVGLFHVNPTDVSKMTDKAGLPVAYQPEYFMAEFNTVQGSDAQVTIYPRASPATALPITTIWYNPTTGKIGLTEGRSSDATNDAKYQHPQLTRADGTAIYLPDKTNWDTLSQTGYYYNQNTGVNTPVGGGYFSLEVIASSGTRYITHRATQNNGDVYIRVFSDSWSKWVLQASTAYVDNKVKTAVDATQVHKLTADNGIATNVNNQDWNTLKSTGFYYSNPAGANAPLPKGHLILEVLSLDNNANIVQRATETLSNRVFKRGLARSNWTAWTELQTKTHETYRVPLNTSVVKNHHDAHPFELNYANGAVSFCNTFSPIKNIPSSSDGFVIGTIADVRYRPTQTIRTLCQGSFDHVFLLTVGTDGTITASRNRSIDVYNLTFVAWEWCNASASYTTNDTHA